MTTAPLAAWKAEIVAELADAERELGGARDAKAAAAADRAAAVEQYRAVVELGATFRQPVPASLARRLDPTGVDVQRAEGAVTRTRMAEQYAEAKAQDLREGLAEVERLLAAAEAEPEVAL